MNRKSSIKGAAVIDIDSNMLKMRIAQLKKGKISDLDRLEHPLRLGHEVFTGGKISFESLRELSGLLRGYMKIVEEYGIKQCRAVATTSFRDAENRSYVLDQIKIQNGLSVEVLEDDQEKTLIYSEILSVLRQTPNYKDESALICYIGAGTIGFSVFDGQHMFFSQNIPMGALKLHDMLGNIQTLTEDFYTVVEEYLETTIGHISIPVENGKVTKLVLTGTGMRLIERVCGIDVAGPLAEVDTQKLKDLYLRIRSMPQEKIGILYHISAEAAELLYSSLAVSLRLLQFTTCDKVLLPNVELWDALMRHMLLPKSEEQYLEHVRESAICCAEKIAEFYHCSRPHSEFTRKTACKIFDKMKGAHGLDRRKRLLLELAAILHESGHYVTVKQHLRSSFDLIRDTDIYGMTDEEMLVTAYVARYNEYDVPNYEESEFLSMSDGNQLVISKLAAIFRLANALDKSGRQKLKNIKIRLNGDRLMISAESKANWFLEKWAFDQCAPFFKEVFGYNPELSVKSIFLN